MRGMPSGFNVKQRNYMFEMTLPRGAKALWDGYPSAKGWMYFGGYENDFNQFNDHRSQHHVV
jgi:hypothetical protein